MAKYRRHPFFSWMTLNGLGLFFYFSFRNPNDYFIRFPLDIVIALVHYFKISMNPPRFHTFIILSSAADRILQSSACKHLVRMVINN